MDLPAILARHPGVCLVDGLAYDNPPGSRQPSRWQDVEELLESRHLCDLVGQYSIHRRVARARGKDHAQEREADHSAELSAFGRRDWWWWMHRPKMCMIRGDRRAERRHGRERGAEAVGTPGDRAVTGRRRGGPPTRSSTSSAMESRRPSARRSESWCALRRAPMPRP